jgi:hypothetical protein
VYEESENETESSDLVFSDKLVNERLLRLESGKSKGLDGLHPQFLRSCADHLAVPIATIVQLSYASGVLPDDWKAATECCIFKRCLRDEE